MADEWGEIGAGVNIGAKTAGCKEGLEKGSRCAWRQREKGRLRENVCGWDRKVCSWEGVERVSGRGGVEDQCVYARRRMKRECGRAC
jgi:hypothetical protein